MLVIVNTEDRLRLLRHAREEIRDNTGSIPSDDFYRRKLGEVWARARGSDAYRGLGAFSRGAFDDLPLTGKNRLKAAPWEYTAVGVDAAAKYYETSGTTGRATPTPRRFEDVVWNVVSVAEAWRPLLGERERVLSLLPSDIVPVTDLVANVCEYLDVPHARAYPLATGVSDWDRVLMLCENFRPTAVFVAPGVALQLTRLLKNRGLLPEVRASVTKLMLLGEVNTRAYRDRLGQWWGAEVYDASYGSTETGTLAAACPGGNQHLLPATNYFEVVTEQGVRPLGAPEAGRLVVTPLNLHARPLLRFDTGDEVALGSGCACGNPMPTVSVQGRASERLRVRDVPLSVRSVEELVFGVSGATGYLIEADDRGTFARLLLERDVEWNRLDEGAMSESVQDASWQHLGLRWDDVAFVNTLPANTKSGGSLKNWKRSNVRRVEAPA